LGINGTGISQSQCLPRGAAAGSGAQTGASDLKQYIIPASIEGRRQPGSGRMMDEFELEPRRKPAAPNDLSLMGIAELEAYIAGLEAEIARTRTEIAEKRGQRRGAEALFKR
jgi:uncharacterized small protein (DUF1192 family)